MAAPLMDNAGLPAPLLPPDCLPAKLDRRQVNCKPQKAVRTAIHTSLTLWPTRS